ncbi:MAG TPA: hypothetical protein EYP33_03530 [Pyrodictium sp.]|nr:hypothetical protein [Pyrodictium sp.]
MLGYITSALAGALGMNFLKSQQEKNSLLAKPIDVDVDIPTDVTIDIPTYTYSPAENISYTYQPVIIWGSPYSQANPTTKKEMSAKAEGRATSYPNIPITQPSFTQQPNSGFSISETTLLLGLLGAGALIILTK